MFSDDRRALLPYIPIFLLHLRNCLPMRSLSVFKVEFGRNKYGNSDLL